MGKRAFTLVELLVVIGIIAVLISILLPALSRARQAALATQCLSNERQVGLMCMMYANENSQYLPPTWAGAMRLMPAATHDALNRVSKNTIGKCFYCPSLPLPTLYLFEALIPGAVNWSPEQQWAQPGSPGLDYVLGYWYMGNPCLAPGSPPFVVSPDAYWVDVNKNGSKKDEYCVKFSEKGAAQKAIMTDIVPQVIGGKLDQLYVRHPAEKYKSGGGSNELFGDGHAEFIRRDQFKLRWYPQRAGCW